MSDASKLSDETIACLLATATTVLFSHHDMEDLA